MTTLDENIKEELWSPTMSSVSSVPELDDDAVSEPRSPLSPRTPGFVQDSGAGSEWTQVDKDSWHEPAGKEQGSTASVAFRSNSPPRSYRRRSNASISKSYANGTIMLVVSIHIHSNVPNLTTYIYSGGGRRVYCRSGAFERIVFPLDGSHARGARR
jgi:hypothetical protein